jgi:ABC-2 type transport system ATP-binding protein
VIALGSPHELIASLGGEHIIEFTLEGDGNQHALEHAALADLPTISEVRKENNHISLSVTEPHRVLPVLLDRLSRLQLELTSLTTRHASLEDVFVKLAGRHLQDAES